MNRDGVLLVGGGLAAQRCCETLRARGYDGPIRIVGAEPVGPYDRPPLSKALLAGSVEPSSLAYRPADWYDDHAVELFTGVRAIHLDAGARTVALADGTSLAYDAVLVATGARARHVGLLETSTNVHLLRGLDDALRLRAAIQPGARVAVVGAGFIGLEVAATARGLGAEVTILETQSSPLAGVLGSQLGSWFAGLHREHGVRVLTSVRLVEARATGTHVEALMLDDGQRIDCDLVVVGVGITPDAGWLGRSGLPDGVPTDETGRTALAGVFAAGDVARPRDPFTGCHVRSEHWEAAGRGGAAAAHAMLGLPAPRAALPAFWSDQYGLRIQLVGHPQGADSHALEEQTSGALVASLTRADQPVAGLTVDRPRALPELRRRIEQTYRIPERNAA